MIKTGKESTHRRGLHLVTFVHYGESRDYNCSIWFLLSFTNVVCHADIFPPYFWTTLQVAESLNQIKIRNKDWSEY